jgi:hypothetical protein
VVSYDALRQAVEQAFQELVTERKVKLQLRQQQQRHAHQQ